MREDIVALKKDIKELKNQSFALEILGDYKKQNKRLFVIWITTFIAFILLLGYVLFLLNDISIVESSNIDIQDVNSIDNSHIKIGDDLWEK
jgi:ATP/ADP translocase